MLVTAGTAGAALAAHPVKGATYTGAFGPQQLSITFKVAANGKRVSHFSFGGFPVGCQGGGFGNPLPASARVSKRGTFKATFRLYFAPDHSTSGHLIVTGKFLKHGGERGTITTKFTTKSCDKSESYAASKG